MRHHRMRGGGKGCQPMREETFRLFARNRLESLAGQKRRRDAMNNAEIFFRDAVMLANAEDVRLEARAQRRPRVNSNITRSSASAL
ncbi:MAG: hypothetical protein JMDDDDMK_00219 [Acidobacteria bacterium]|nr:hypothetical protein [Acidobacteriota bacterium]